MRTVTVLRGAAQIAPLFYGFGHRCKFIGGFVRWMVSPNLDPVPAGDIDIYPNSPDDSVAIQDWIMNNIPLEKVKGNQFMHETDISVNFKPKSGNKLQVIKPVNQGHIVANGSLEQILENFDFTVCRAGLVSLTEALVDDEFIQDEMKKKLTIKSIHCPIGAIKRIAKYSMKGYYISPAELYKLFNDWDRRSADYKEELRQALALWEDMQNGVNADEMELTDLEGQDIKKKVAHLIYVD
jgi:hypothetical protein